MSAAGTSLSRSVDGTLVVRLSGDWSLRAAVPSASEVEAEMARPPGVSRVAIDASGLGAWDSSLVAFLVSLSAGCQRRQLELDAGSCPPGLRRLLALARSTVHVASGSPGRHPHHVPYRVGRWAIATAAWAGDMLGFVGESAVAVKDLVLQSAHYRRIDFEILLEEVGGSALPLVGIINFLVGAVLAFLGAVQLQRFGASIYVASLVGVGTVRETGALMTGIVMAGRSGASFAAVLGTMKVNSEVDALETMNFPPLQFLVAPRVVAMLLMMPLLVVYADGFGIMGGFFVAVTTLDITPVLYLNETQRSLAIHDVAVGVMKGFAFGAVVALSGCYFGMRTGRTASAVGASTTSAVVTGILLVIVVDALLTFFFYAVGM